MLDVVSNRLCAIAEEIQFMLERSANSPSMLKGIACSASIFDCSGPTVVEHSDTTFAALPGHALVALDARGKIVV